MTQRVEGGLTYTQTFDAENRLISVTVSGQTTQFIYDGDGNLVKKIKPDNSKTIYVGGIYEVDKTSGGSVTRTVTYYPAAGAMRINSTLYYTLKDHLGSASVVTDASGVTVSGGEQRYYPYGEGRLTATMLTDKLFTGQREMAGLGIYHYGARFYSPKLGRFLSADTIIPGAANPQAYNRYSYVLNNPLLYTDPTGHAQSCEDGDVCSSGGGSNTCYPGELVCQLGKSNYKPKTKDQIKKDIKDNIIDPALENLTDAAHAATTFFTHPYGGFGQVLDPACNGCGSAIDFGMDVVSFVSYVAESIVDYWYSIPTQPLFPTPLPSFTPDPTATITPHYTPTVTSTATAIPPLSTPSPTLTQPTLISTTISTPWFFTPTP